MVVTVTFPLCPFILPSSPFHFPPLIELSFSFLIPARSQFDANINSALISKRSRSKLFRVFMMGSKLSIIFVSNNLCHIHLPIKEMSQFININNLTLFLTNSQAQRRNRRCRIRRFYREILFVKAFQFIEIIITVMTFLPRVFQSSKS